jgi:hypothetical protein
MTKNKGMDRREGGSRRRVSRSRRRAESDYRQVVYRIEVEQGALSLLRHRLRRHGRDQRRSGRRNAW